MADPIKFLAGGPENRVTSVAWDGAFYYTGALDTPVYEQMPAKSILITKVGIRPRMVLDSSWETGQQGVDHTTTYLYKIYDTAGNEVGQLEGSSRVIGDGNLAGSTLTHVITNLPDVPESGIGIPEPSGEHAWQVFNGVISGLVYLTGLPPTYAWAAQLLSAEWTDVSPSYEGLQGVGSYTLVKTSDNVVLASIPYKDNPYVSVAKGGGITNYPKITGWAGAGWLQLFNSDDAELSWSAGERVSFAVPDDAVLGAANTPALPPGCVLPTWEADWASANQEFHARMLVFSENNAAYVDSQLREASDALYADMVEGPPPAGLLREMEARHPIAIDRTGTQEQMSEEQAREALRVLYEYRSVEEMLDGEGYNSEEDFLDALGAGSFFEALQLSVGEGEGGSYPRPLIKNGERIDVFVLSKVSDTLGDLGVFYTYTPDHTPSRLRAVSKTTYTYDAKADAWSTRTTPISVGEDKTPYVDLPFSAGIDIVFRSRVVPWPELRGPKDSDGVVSPLTYAGQRSLMSTSPEDYPLFVPLKAV